MHALMLEILPWFHEGNCCSQILFRLMTSLTGREEPSTMLALKGLCHGIGMSGGPCGLLTGGACALSLAVGGGNDPEREKIRQEILADYATWFYGEMEERFGGVDCEAITKTLQVNVAADSYNPVACGEILCSSWEKIAELLQAYEIVPEDEAR